MHLIRQLIELEILIQLCTLTLIKKIDIDKNIHAKIQCENQRILE